MKSADLIEKICKSNAPSYKECQEIFEALLSGELGAEQVTKFLQGLRNVGENADALVAGAETMRHLAVKVDIPERLRPLTDNCGTGGDGASSFNISTAAAIVAASAGAHMAKHGNRSISSKCGSADLLFAAGFPSELDGSSSIALLEKTGFTFFFAPGFHPSLRPIMPIRKAISGPTIFNLLGPLANPVHPEFQILGVGQQKHLVPMAEALMRLGCERALVIHSRDGLDELSPSAASDCILLENGAARELTVDPAKFGIKSASFEELKGGDATKNLQLLTELFDRNGNASIFAAVVLNAGAVLWISNKTASLKEGVELARSQLDSKLAREYFRSWIHQAKQV